jgi:anti-sigma-K factor RskA
VSDIVLANEGRASAKKAMALHQISDQPRYQSQAADNRDQLKQRETRCQRDQRSRVWRKIIVIISIPVVVAVVIVYVTVRVCDACIALSLRIENLDSSLCAVSFDSSRTLKRGKKFRNLSLNQTAAVAAAATIRSATCQ